MVQAKGQAGRKNELCMLSGKIAASDSSILIRGSKGSQRLFPVLSTQELRPKLPALPLGGGGAWRKILGLLETVGCLEAVILIW